MLKDIEISQSAKMMPIEEVAKKVGLQKDDLEFYGKFKAKISQEAYKRLEAKEDAKLIVVSAINPTPAGEGKTTVSIGLSQGLNRIGETSVLALREPSLGPVFGIKGGAAGGGYSQVVPMEDINLHFTGDMHAITAANNLLCAMVDSHMHNGNELGINLKTIVIKRCLDMNDRALRNIIIGLGKPVDGVVRQDGFIITVASEIMAIMCLAEDLDDLKRRFGNILIGYNFKKEPVFARDLKANGAMTALMKDALSPNLVQTLENTPAFVHGGPFANIAHGCNSVKATKLALKLSNYAVTEAGFGSDLGLEKFFNIKCRYAKLEPNCVVLVATIRALKYNGGVLKENLEIENKEAVERGLCNLKKHIENVKRQCKNLVVALNRFVKDTQEEIEVVRRCCEEEDVLFVCADVFTKGGEGAIELAKAVKEVCNRPKDFRFLYEDEISLKEKIETIATKVYGADGVTYSDVANKKILEYENMGFSNIPVCIAKTQYSLSTDPKKLGRPTGFSVFVNDVSLSAGAGFLVVLTNNVMTMPGLSKTPAANFVDVVDGKIQGLF